MHTVHVRLERVERTPEYLRAFPTRPNFQITRLDKQITFRISSTDFKAYNLDIDLALDVASHSVT